MTNTASRSCALIHSGASYRGKQGLDYAGGISAESVGAQGLCMTVLDLPPGARAKPHLHAEHETAIYVVSGTGEMLYGEGLRERMTFAPGDFIYIPDGAPHLPINTSATEHLVAVISRTDPNEQESVVLLPEPQGISA
jgi:uncharacterized RmlC-like cupin family protein